MDPISLAGLGLGAASLAFQLFAGCIKGFVLLSTAHNLGKDSSYLLCSLNLQEIQLVEWARRAGLLEGTLDKRLNENVTQATLTELQDLLLNTDKLKTRYKLSLVAKSFSSNSGPNGLESPVVQGILRNAISDDVRGDIMYRAKIIKTKNQFPQRLWWAAVDKTKFEELVEKIKFFIRELWHLLDPYRQDDMSKSLEMILSHVIDMNTKVGDLSSLRDSLSYAATISDPSDQTSRPLALASMADVKAARINIGLTTEDDESTGLPSGVDQCENYLAPSSQTMLEDIDKDHIKEYAAIKSSPEMGMAKYKDRHVLIEWKSLPVQNRSKIIERARNLAMLLHAPKHPGFRSLRCRGLARDNDGGKVAFVYDMHISSDLSPPQSLRSLFGKNPSVTERLRLALEISRSVKYFHTAGWLHKNLRSENILLLPSQSLLANPLLAGFAFSRLNSPSEISDYPSVDPQRDLYRHPDAMGDPSVSFSASKDIYALGTVFLEIGEWRPLKSLVDGVIDFRKPDVSTMELAKVRPFLLDDGPRGGLGMLRYRMGDVYAGVTKMMLSEEIPESLTASTGTGDILRPGILDVAIRKLEGCIV
ncbi:hypothetical protein MMC28_008984 [Mycoblastus sanguinarius]|nr:hypothetical protein [Mycoblastus sanguinarius]